MRDGGDWEMKMMVMGASEVRQQGSAEPCELV
jgi:hypothetical protein